MNTQSGPLSSGMDGVTRLDLEVRYGVGWISMNDHIRFILHPDGFGKKGYTKSRKTTKSEFFDGEYVISESRDNSPQSISVWVLGSNFMELHENVDLLMDAFNQNPFIIRTRMNEMLITESSSGSADFIVDMSHVYLHNFRALVQVNFNLKPGQELEMIL